MKNFEQMASDVLQRRDEALAVRAKQQRSWRRIGTVAAICIITVGTTAGIWGATVMNRRQDTPGLSSDQVSAQKPPRPTETREDGVFWEDTRIRKGLHFSKTELGILWPWEELTDAERYTQMSYDGNTYYMRGTVQNYLGEKLSDGEAYGFEEDWSTGKRTQHTVSCEIYSLTFSPDHSVVAVCFEEQNEFYRFECERAYDPPKTLGEFMETRKLSEVLPLTTLYYNSGKSETKQSLSYGDSDAVWKILAQYGDAPFVEKYTYYHNKEDVGFAATSEVLGIRNLSFTINEDGYIVTNIERYGYHYFIGVDAAREVIDYVKAHMTDPLPDAQTYTYTIVGTVTEIGDGYIKVDDSIMMKDPRDGLEFTIITERKELSRVVTHLLRVGSRVMVTYDGFVSKEDPLRIDYASAIDEVYITEDGDVQIPE